MAYEVRAAESGDLLAVLQVLARSDEGRNPWPTEATSAEVAMWNRMMGTDDVIVYVGVLDDEIVATATFLVLPNITYDCQPTGFIEAMVVRSEHRRLGLARKLLDQLLEDAAALGCNKIQLLSHKNHAGDGAHDLYSSAGFTAEAEGFRLYLQADR